MGFVTFDKESMAGFLRRRSPPRREMVVSLVLVVVTHGALASVPFHLSPFLSLLAMLPVSGLVLVAALVLGRCFKLLIGVSSSAPALVFFHLLSIWAVYLALINQASSPILKVIFNMDCMMLVFGLYTILSSDPGLVSCGNSCPGIDECENHKGSQHHEVGSSLSRVRHCRNCKACIRGFDHHCPAFGNCIGQKNYFLFMITLVGFIVGEATYVICSTTAKYLHCCIKRVEHQLLQLQLSDITKFIVDGGSLERNYSVIIATSTMQFCVLQVIWQVLFLAWHLYCICCNIRTDEWINWKKYPEFHVQSQTGHISGLAFRNPYDKGIASNIKEFIRSK